MNSQITGLKVAGTVLGLLGFLQLVRLLLKWEVIVNHREIPLWFSGLAVGVLACLSVWLFRLAGRRL